MSEVGRRRALGRGLDALIVDTGGESAEQGESAERGSPGAASIDAAGPRLIAIAAIQPNPRQPRTHFDEAALDELAASIRQHGIIQPLVVTRNAQLPDMYWLIAGERRWRAAQRAGVESVPAILREATSQQLVELALIENVQRADLNPLEEATAYQTLIDEFGLTQADVADRVGKSRSAVANAVRLLGLPADVQRALVDGVVTAGHARALLALPSSGSIAAALAEVIRRELNVRQTEALVKRLLAATGVPRSPAAPDPDPRVQAQIAHMEERLRRALGTRVALVRNADGSGRLVVHFFNDDDLDALYAQIAGTSADSDDSANFPFSAQD